MITLNLSHDEAIQLLTKVLYSEKTLTEKEKELANKIANSLGMKVVFHGNSHSIVNINMKDEEAIKMHQELKKSLDEIIEKAQKEKTLKTKNVNNIKK